MDLELLAIQKRLAELGHSPGPADGVWGPSTRAAVALSLGINAAAKLPAAGAVDAPWLDLARQQLGVHEVAGAASSGVVQAYFQTAAGAKYADSVPWCAAFVGAMLEAAGYRGTGSLMARSYLTWGTELKAPRVGAVVVFKRGTPPAGHVGFITGVDGPTIKCLGGNQGNAVSIASYARSSVLGYRWPSEVSA